MTVLYQANSPRKMTFGTTESIRFAIQVNAW